MGQSLDQILATVKDLDTVNVSMVSNQDNGIASYAVGGLVFHKSTGGVIFGGPPLVPARLQSALPLKMYFSDRMLDIDPAPPPGTFGHLPRQPFNANATEQLGMTITVGTLHAMTLAVFGSKSVVTLTPMGDVLVGLGPSLGNSAAGVFVVAFLGITRPSPPPH